MIRRPLTTSQLVALTVPFLLILLLVPTTPRLVTITHTHEVRLIERARASTSPRVVRPKVTAPAKNTESLVVVVQRRVVEAVVSTPPPAPSVTKSSPTSAGSTKSTVTTIVPSAPYVPPHGVLEPPYTYVVQQLAPGTKWTLTSDQPLEASMSCDGVNVPVAAPEIDVPSTSTTCTFTLHSTSASAVTWTLTPHA